MRRGVFSRFLLIGGLIFIVYSFFGDFQVDAALRYRLNEPLGAEERLELDYLAGDGEILARAVFYAGEERGREITHELRLPKGHHRVELRLFRRGDPDSQVVRMTHDFKMPLEGVELVRVETR